jgi:hypothetical protein
LRQKGEKKERMMVGHSATHTRARELRNKGNPITWNWSTTECCWIHFLQKGNLSTRSRSTIEHRRIYDKVEGIDLISKGVGWLVNGRWRHSEARSGSMAREG